MRALLVVALLVGASPAHASDSLANWLVGPLVGVRLDGSPKSRLVLGVEGGGGWGPERINLGFEHRDPTQFYYLELDPWYFVGGSLGLGVDSDGKSQPVLGLWEGVPFMVGPGYCGRGWHTEITFAVGYRYTGIHELYMTLKAGMLDGDLCLG